MLSIAFTSRPLKVDRRVNKARKRWPPRWPLHGLSCMRMYTCFALFWKPLLWGIAFWIGQFHLRLQALSHDAQWGHPPSSFAGGGAP